MTGSKTTVIVIGKAGFGLEFFNTFGLQARQPSYGRLVLPENISDEWEDGQHRVLVSGYRLLLLTKDNNFPSE